MQIRPIEPADLAACAEVFFAAEDHLYERHNLPHLPRNIGSLERLFGHIIGANPGRAWLAEDAAGVVAFVMATQRERFWFLSFLFVRPEHQSRGLGRMLLERCLPPPGSADVLGTCVEAIQPVSTGLYAAYGLVPRVPIYTLVGKPRQPLGGLAAGLHLVPFDELAGRDHGSLVGTVDALDREVFGFARGADHAALRSWAREGYLLLRGGEPIGYGYAQAAGRLGPAVVRDPDLLGPLVGELMTRIEPVDAWQILVPGVAAAAMVGLLRAGLRYDGPPALYSATHPGPDLSRALPASFAFL